MTQVYPLQWPPGRKRGPTGGRMFGRFKTTGNGGGYVSLSVADARGRLQRELDRIGARYSVISSNVELRLDGQPRRGQPEPADRGVAVYFRLGDKPHCFPCDTYMTVADNIAAIAAHIEATRMIERHGVASIAEMFSGFVALPPPPNAEPWHVVLKIAPSASAAQIETAYRTLAKSAHPDTGGSPEAWGRLERARDAARKELTP